MTKNDLRGIVLKRQSPVFELKVNKRRTDTSSSDERRPDVATFDKNSSGFITGNLMRKRAFFKNCLLCVTETQRLFLIHAFSAHLQHKNEKQLYPCVNH